MDSKETKNTVLTNPLNKPISFGKRTIRYPTKTAMNLYVKAMSAHSLAKTVCAITIFALAAAALTKFGVLNRLDKVASARAELEGYLQQQSELTNALTDLQQIKENYQRYTKHYQTAEEAVLIERLALIETLDHDAAGLVQISSVAISGDSATVTIIAAELTRVAQYKQVLETCDYFTAANVYNASTVEDQDTLEQYVTATIVLALAQEVAE